MHQLDLASHQSLHIAPVHYAAGADMVELAQLGAVPAKRMTGNGLRISLRVTPLKLRNKVPRVCIAEGYFFVQKFTNICLPSKQ